MNEQLQRLISANDTKANIISSSSSLKEISFALTTDTSEFGFYINGSWSWLSASALGSISGSSVMSNTTGSIVKHNESGVSAGNYLSTNVTVDKYGHITSATNGASASSIGAPSDSTFITSGSNTGITNYRILGAGSNVSFTTASYSGGSIIIHAAGGNITSASANCESDVTMTTADVYYDGASISLAAGTWFISGHLTMQRTSTAGAQACICKIWDGTNAAVASAQQDIASVSYKLFFALSAIVTIGTTTTYRISATNTANGGTILQNTVDGGPATSATGISAIKLA